MLLIYQCYESLIKTKDIQHNEQQQTIKSQRATIKSQQAIIKSQQDRLEKLKVMNKRYRIISKNIPQKNEQAKAQTGNNGNRKLKKRRFSQIWWLYDSNWYLILIYSELVQPDLYSWLCASVAADE